MRMCSKLLGVIALAVGTGSLGLSANAAPIAPVPALQKSGAPALQSVQWRWGWRGGRGWAPGLAAGAIVGGAIAATQPWAYGGYYDDYAYAPGYSYGSGYGYRGDAEGYCAQRFRSYDPASGTYLGYDGERHSCP